VKPGIAKFVVAGGLGLACGFASSSVRAAEPFTLRSPALEDNGLLALKNAGNDSRSPNCVGDNVSPPLAWSNPPEGTQSFALMLVDPEGGVGLGAIHWVAYGIPPEVTGFAEGEASRPSDKFVGGVNGRGVAFYSGPCPPPGGWHHYTFTLIATDLDPKALPPGLTREALLAALKGHAKAAAGLIGRFKHQ
jgi:Raf kinase inhibitor-like YbhB/YbcL family protein